MKKAAVFFALGFEEVEALTQVDLLRRAGIDVDMVSITDETSVFGAHNIEVVCDEILEEIDKDSYDALILPGGMPGTKNLGNCSELIEMLKKYNEEGKVVAAICAAPMVLGRNGILEGKKACCYPGFEEFLEGAEVCEDKVAADGNVITSRGVGTAIEFAGALIEALVGKDAADEVKESIIY